MRKLSLSLLLTLMLLLVCAAPVLAYAEPVFMPRVDISTSGNVTTVTVYDQGGALETLQPSLTVAWSGADAVSVTGPDDQTHDYTADNGQVTFSVYQAGSYILTATGRGGSSSRPTRDDPAPPAPLAPAFTDVAAEDWFYPYVNDLSAAAVVNGYPDGSFRPQAAVSYGEALKLILLAAGYGQQPPTAEHWASGYLTQAQQLGYIGAVADLNAPIDRLCVAQLTAKAMRLAASVNSPSPFADCEDGYLLALYQAGIMEGSFNAAGERLYQPADSITRAEIATIIWRINEYSK